MHNMYILLYIYNYVYVYTVHTLSSTITKPQRRISTMASRSGASVNLAAR